MWLRYYLWTSSEFYWKTVKQEPKSILYSWNPPYNYVFVNSFSKREFLSSFFYSIIKNLHLVHLKYKLTQIQYWLLKCFRNTMDLWPLLSLMIAPSVVVSVNIIAPQQVDNNYVQYSYFITITNPTSFSYPT